MKKLILIILFIFPNLIFSQGELTELILENIQIKNKECRCEVFENNNKMVFFRNYNHDGTLENIAVPNSNKIDTTFYKYSKKAAFDIIYEVEEDTIKSTKISYDENKNITKKTITQYNRIIFISTKTESGKGNLEVNCVTEKIYNNQGNPEKEITKYQNSSKEEIKTFEYNGKRTTITEIDEKNTIQSQINIEKDKKNRIKKITIKVLPKTAILALEKLKIKSF